MTREEAIEKLKLYDNYFYGIWGKDKCRNVFDVAIEALSAKTDGDLISRADAMAYIERVINSGLGKKKSLDYIHKYISSLPSAERNCFTCGMENGAMKFNPENVSDEVIEANDRTVKLSDVCKFVKANFELNPKQWGELRSLPSSEALTHDKHTETHQPEPIRINLNESIKVKLTDLGKEIYYHQYDRTNQIAGREICKPKFPKEDENGYTEFQLWCFIELYGEHMGMAMPNVIKPLEIVYER